MQVFSNIRMFFIAALAMLAACNNDSDPKPNNNFSNEKPKIDLFTSDAVAYQKEEKTLNKDTAFAHSSYVLLASNVQLVDSSYNRTVAGNFYLFSAEINQVLKGKPLKTKYNTIYFIASSKLPFLQNTVSTLFLNTLLHHKIIKSKLNIPFQWLHKAPIIY